MDIEYKGRGRGGSYRLRVLVSTPLRLYLKHTPWKRGRGLVMWKILRPLLPPQPASFVAELPRGLRLELRYRELLGLEVLTDGFEQAEAEALRAATVPGSIAVDAGANVGFHTVVLADAIGPGRVWAFEPMQPTAERLRANLRLNGLDGVTIRVAAVGDTEGTVELQVSADDAVHSTVGIHILQAPAIARRTVEAVTLDGEWQRAGRPHVSVAKIDVEGAELAVLAGASELVETCRPTLLIEAPTNEQEQRLRAWLEPRGYDVSRPPDFKSWNVLAVPASP